MWIWTFPDRRNKDRLVNLYLLTHGYERERLSEFEERYALVVRSSKGDERVYLDVATAADPNRLHGSTVEVPWQLGFDHSVPATFEGVDFYVPRPEVLLVLKAKAALDREHDAKRTFDPFFLQQKAWKDYYDLASILMACTVDVDFLESVVTEHRFETPFRRAMHQLARKRAVLERRGVRWSELRTKLGRVL